MRTSPRLLVLYSRSDALGDGVMRIPALRAARSAFPEARIVYAAGGATVLESLLHRHVADVVDEVRPGRLLPDLLDELRPEPRTAAVADFRTVVGWMAVEKARLLPRRIVYEANFPGYALSPLRGVGPRPEHNARRCHRLIERLARRRLPFDARLDVLDSARAEAQRILQGRAAPLVLLSGNSNPGKALTLEQLAPLARALLQRRNDVVYIHSPGQGPSASDVADDVAGVMTIGPDGVNGVPLLELCLALGEAARAWVGPEGGLAHCMAAAGTPVVIVNHGARMERWRPLTDVVEVVEARASSTTGRSAGVPAGVILRAVERVIERARS